MALDVELDQVSASRLWPCQWGRLLVAVLGAFALGLIVGEARAQSGNHNDGHAGRHDWYRDLKQPGTGFSCCNGTAAGVRPTRAELRDDGWWAVIDGQWAPIPWSVVLDPSLNKEPIYGHVCARETGRIYCFMPAGARR